MRRPASKTSILYPEFGESRPLISWQQRIRTCKKTNFTRLKGWHKYKYKYFGDYLIMKSSNTSNKGKKSLDNLAGYLDILVQIDLAQKAKKIQIAKDTK